MLHMLQQQRGRKTDLCSREGWRGTTYWLSDRPHGKSIETQRPRGVIDFLGTRYFSRESSYFVPSTSGRDQRQRRIRNWFRSSPSTNLSPGYFHPVRTGNHAIKNASWRGRDAARIKRQDSDDGMKITTGLGILSYQLWSMMISLERSASWHDTETEEMVKCRLRQTLYI